MREWEGGQSGEGSEDGRPSFPPGDGRLYILHTYSILAQTARLPDVHLSLPFMRRSARRSLRHSLLFSSLFV